MEDKEIIIRKIENCPFCGKRGHKRTIIIKHTDYPFMEMLKRRRSIECRNKKCSIRPSTWLYVNTDDWDKVIDAWNLRVPSRSS